MLALALLTAPCGLAFKKLSAMKRANYFEIILKCQVLTGKAVLWDVNQKDENYLPMQLHRINRATKNEIINLDAKLERLASETKRRLDQETTTPDTAYTSAGVPGQLAEPFDMICNTLKTIPGSGYEFLNEKP